MGINVTANPVSGGHPRADSIPRFRDLVPLALMAIVLSLGARTLAGDLAIPLLGVDRWVFMVASVATFGLLFFLAVLLHSASRARHHRNPATGHVQLLPLWKAMDWNPLPGTAVVLLTFFGITATGNLAEIYRAGISSWNDAILWRLEYPLFSALHGSWLDRPQLWDIIYFQLWTVVLLAAVDAYRSGGLRRCAVLGGAIVLAFYVARGINLAFPTAGPAFFQPAWFALEGTLSQGAQAILREYMAGRIPANGVYPATMAMPSLHVGLAGLAAGFLARGRTWTLLFSVPWVLLVWLSTVVLGWHYALDGAVGLLVAGLATLLASRLQDGWDRWSVRLYGSDRQTGNLVPFRRLQYSILGRRMDGGTD